MNEDSNADSLVNFFHGLSDELKRDIARKGVRKATGRVYNRAMANVNGPRTAPSGSYPVPVRTAELRNGIKPIYDGGSGLAGLPDRPEGFDVASAVVSTAHHSALIHDGHAEPIEIVPVNAKALKFKVIGGIQTHYKRGAKAGQKLASPKITFTTLFRKKVILPPAGPRPYLEDARNGSADEAIEDMASEVIARIEEANGGGDRIG